MKKPYIFSRLLNFPNFTKNIEKLIYYLKMIRVNLLENINISKQFIIIEI